MFASASLANFVNIKNYAETSFASINMKDLVIWAQSSTLVSRKPLLLLLLLEIK